MNHDCSFSSNPKELPFEWLKCIWCQRRKVTWFVFLLSYRFLIRKKKERKKDREKVRAFEILADFIGEWNYFGRFLPLWKGVWRRVRRRRMNSYQFHPKMILLKVRGLLRSIVSLIFPFDTLRTWTCQKTLWMRFMIGNENIFVRLPTTFSQLLGYVDPEFAQ